MVQPTVYYGIKNEAVSLTCTVESDKTLVINWFKGKKLHLARYDRNQTLLL